MNDTSSIKTHFRRCHLCGQVNASEGEIVHKCESCGKNLAPFFFFDEKKAMGLVSDPEKTLQNADDAEVLKYPPLWGITVIW